MNILDKRPLSTVLIAVLSTFVFFCGFPSYLKITVLVIVLGSFILTLLPKSIFPRFLRILLISVFVAALLSDFYFNGYYFAEKRFCGEVQIVGTVEEISYAEQSGAVFEIKTDSIQEKPFSKYRLLVHLNNVDASTLKNGDKISFSATLLKLDDAYEYAEGISAYANGVDSYCLLSEDNVTLRIQLNTYRKTIKNVILSVSKDTEVGGLLSALLIGDKTNLSKQLSLDFQRIGVSHILALSGMHLAIITLFLSFLLSVFGLGKRTVKIILLFFIPAYIILTGASPSILRAGIMILISTLLFLNKRKSDALTTLLFTVFLIVLLEPFTVFSVSLWLSALATFGILTIPSAVESKPKSKFFCYIFSSLIISFSAIFFTLPITGFLFGTFSVLAPIGTLIISILTQGYIYLGIFTLLFGTRIPSGFLLEKLYCLIETTAKNLSDIPFSTVDVSYTLTKILIIIFAVVATMFLLANIQKKKTYFLSLCCFLFIIAGIGALLEIRTFSKDSLYYINDQSDEYMLVTTNKKNVLFDFSTDSSSSVYEVNNKLNILHVRKLDTLVISQYSASLPYALSVYLSKMPIKEIYLPVAQNSEELELLKQVKIQLLKYRTSVSFYESDEHIACGNFAWHPIYVPKYGKDSGSVFVISKDADTLFTYFGKGTYFDLKKETATDLTANSTAVVFGCHGYQNQNNEIVDLKNDDLSVAVFADENIIIDKESDLSKTEIYASKLPSIIRLYVE